MPRPLRPPIENGLYHVTSRGNRRCEIYRDGADKKYFLGLLANVVERCGWLLHAYCLMTNHYHLVARTPLANISRGMRRLNGMHAQWFGSAERPAFLACDAILEELGPRLDDAQAAYASFVKAGIDDALRARYGHVPGLTPDAPATAMAA